MFDDVCDRSVSSAGGSTDDNCFFSDGQEFVPAELKIHIGANTFATAKKSYQTVDIRHHFFTNQSSKSVHPTRRGISLNKYEFSKLVSHLPDLESIWYGLRELQECSKTHTQGQALMCTHCTPTPQTTEKKIPQEKTSDSVTPSTSLATPSTSFATPSTSFATPTTSLSRATTVPLKKRKHIIDGALVAKKKHLQQIEIDDDDDDLLVMDDNRRKPVISRIKKSDIL